MGRLELQINSYGKILDRCAIISERVYGTVVRTGPIVSEVVLEYYTELFIQNNWILYYCRPSRESLLLYVERDLDRVIRETGKTHKPLGHVQLVKERMNQLIDKYDEVIDHIKSKGMEVRIYVRPEPNL